MNTENVIGKFVLNDTYMIIFQKMSDTDWQTKCQTEFQPMPHTDIRIAIVRYLEENRLYVGFGKCDQAVTRS